MGKKKKYIPKPDPQAHRGDGKRHWSIDSKYSICGQLLSDKGLNYSPSRDCILDLTCPICDLERTKAVEEEKENKSND